MNLSDYQMFVTIAECRNLTLAASRLHLTKSAVSHALAKLERQLQFPLFYRNQKNMLLTSIGAELLPYAHAVLRENDNFKEQIYRLQGLDTGLVRVGTWTSTGIHWIPDIVNSFRSQYPQIEIQVRSGANNVQLLKWLTNHEIDIGIGDAEPSADLKVEELYQDEMLCVTSRTFQPVNPAYVTPEDIQNMPLILQDGDYSQEAIETLEKININSFSSFTAYDDFCLVAMAESGLGYCVEGKLALKKLHMNVSAYSFHPPIYRRICLLQNNRVPASPAIREMCRCIREYAAAYPPYELQL